MNADDLRRLSDLASLRAARDRGALAAVETRAAPIRAAIAALEAPAPADAPADLGEARAQLAHMGWAVQERTRLTMELARLRAELEHARHAAAKATAREQVIAELGERMGRTR
ncbi:hypothetical protein [Jannaschia sp. LMIT008]|uniref:hypothetical protein n=1 Tax=Jannaschia maritima TaxID=3032585 RepID=UPI002810AD21|nr:hypothetical protein [Jannaschia sp. LMIT008]